MVSADLDMLAALWAETGGEPGALDHVGLTGEGPVLPSSYRVAEAAQAMVATVGLAAAEAWHRTTGRRQRVTVERRHAAAEFRSERLLTIDGAGPSSLWDPIAGLYRTADGWIRIHTNFPHHRDAVCDVLGCFAEREKVAAAIACRGAEEFESALHAAGGVGAALRSTAAWDASAPARAVAAEPLIAVRLIGEAPARPLPGGTRPLSGLKVLDLTRIIAGPVAGRTLAAHGATVMRVAAPHLPFIDWAVKDTGRGKLSAYCDLATDEGRAAFGRMLDEADIVLDAYRPGALAALGLDAGAMARRRPGLVHISLAAWGHTGPWAGRRGFDSLVQTASGINDEEGRAAGRDRPLELPCQALDHGTGMLMAAAAILTRLRQATDGGSWSVRLSLARTAHWLRGLGRVENGHATPDPGRGAFADLLDEAPSPFGAMSFVRHAARLSETPPRWERPAVALGTHSPVWPAAS